MSNPQEQISQESTNVGNNTPTPNTLEQAIEENKALQERLEKADKRIKDKESYIQKIQKEKNVAMKAKQDGGWIEHLSPEERDNMEHLAANNSAEFTSYIYRKEQEYRNNIEQMVDKEMNVQSQEQKRIELDKQIEQYKNIGIDLDNIPVGIYNKIVKGEMDLSEVVSRMTQAKDNVPNTTNINNTAGGYAKVSKDTSFDNSHLI